LYFGQELDQAKMEIFEQVLSQLKEQAEAIALRSYSPYTGRKEAVVILLEDGAMVGGVRVENASFQLTIPPILNAITTSYALQRKDFSLIVSTVPFTEAELAYTSALGPYQWELVSPRILVVAGAHHPDPTTFLPVSFPSDIQNAADGANCAREAAKAAFIPESNFPVGCAITTTSGQVVPGVNVEHPDWSQILCAERNALSTIITYALGDITDVYVSCPKLPGGTPCGACRQVIVELAPKATVWMDLDDENPQAMKATELLPGHFTGDILKRP